MMMGSMGTQYNHDGPPSIIMMGPQASWCTCTGRPCGRSSAGGGSWVGGRPSPGMSRTGRWFSCAAPRIAARCKGRRARRGCTPPARAPGSGAARGGTSAGCSGLCHWASWCRPGRTRSAGHRTSQTARSPALPSGRGSDRPGAARRRLGHMEGEDKGRNSHRYYWNNKKKVMQCEESRGNQEEGEIEKTRQG